ncbi:hypothetical protein SHM_11250 [Spiroplasma ixodetis]|uniref:Uncharacterized protein n=1 Tax=Spiroplasma ixodetis TaxID=2141 RepID=A0ABN6SZW4_9MOLU|nr:hypothetical protein SHM_11250 [Spiroplasma ixodetis]
MLVFDELGLKINSNDLSSEFKETQESLGMFCKLWTCQEKWTIKVTFY